MYGIQSAVITKHILLVPKHAQEYAVPGTVRKGEVGDQIDGCGYQKEEQAAKQ